MSEKTIIELYNKYAKKAIKEAKARKARNTSLENKLHYEMVDIRGKISQEIEKISGIPKLKEDD